MWLTHLLDFHNILVEVPYDPSHSANKQNTQSKHNITRARGYNTFFMLNSSEHEILNAYKYKDKEIKYFSGSDKPKMLFVLLLKVEMPIIVGISAFRAGKNSCSSELSMKNV